MGAGMPVRLPPFPTFTPSSVSILRVQHLSSFLGSLQISSELPGGGQRLMTVLVSRMDLGGAAAWAGIRGRV